jgi:predicted Fe-Mo cluster-binding NifX family protein
MKLCITSTGKDMDSKGEEHFGRSPYFLIVDTETLDFKTVPNTAQTTGRGAGIGASQIVLDNNAEAVLTGFVGPNAFNALRASHIRIYEGLSSTNTVREAVGKFNKGEYEDSAKNLLRPM